MKQTIYKAIAVLILLQIASGQLMSYDPTTSSATATVMSQNEDSYKWFYKRAITAASFSFESVRFDTSAAVGSMNKVAWASTTDNTLRAVSKGYTCAALYDATSGSERFSIVKFDSTADDLVEDLKASTFALTVVSIPTKTFEVADLCTALRVDGAVYHLDATIVTVGATKYVADTLPGTAWTNPAFSSDFTFVAGDAGLYKYTAGTKTYASILANTFYTNKKIWTTADAIVVISWVDTTANIKNYSVQAFAIPASGTTYTLAGRIDGQYYDTVANAAPTISVSTTLKTVVIYGKATATTFFAKGKSFDYTLKTNVEFTIPTWITDTQSAVSVSDQYLYARNIVNNAATVPAKQVGSYFIAGAALTEYLAPATVVAGDLIADWTRTKVSSTRTGQLYLIRESLTATKVLSLTEQTVSPPAALQVFSWDKKEAVLTATLTGAGTSYTQHESKPQWFLQAAVSGTSRKFYNVRADPTTFALIKTTYSSDQTYTVKKVSANQKCALLYETVGPSLKVVDLSTAGAGTVFATVGAALYTGIDLAAVATTFDVADNCKALRINTVILHYYTASSAYFVDTYPVGTASLANVVFNEDFSLAVADAGVFAYTAKTALADGIYNLDRADTYATDKSIWKDGNNYVIATHVALNGTHFTWRVQLSTIASSVSTKMTEFTGTVQTNKATIKVSPKLTKIIIQGLSSADATIPVYVGKTVDWPNKVVKDIVLPTILTAILAPKFSLSDDFVYLNNVAGDKKHSAWGFMGSTCVLSFSVAYPYPSTDYERSIIVPDQTGLKKLIILHQYKNADYERLLLDKKKSMSQLLNPTPVSTAEMTFSKTGGSSFVYAKYPFFGRWMYTTATGTSLNYVEYDSTVALTKKKLVTKTGLTGDNLIKATSTNFDCALTFVAGSDLNTIRINTTDSTTTTLSAWAAVVTSTDMTSTQVNTAITAGKVSVSAGCSAVRIGDLVYFKNAAGTAFTKSAMIATLTTPVFDSTLTFAYAGGKVYQNTGTDYVEIITVTGLKTTVTIAASSDNKKIAILSYQLSAVGASSYTSVIKLYYYTTSWNSVTLPSTIASFTTYNSIPTLISESTMQTFGLYYNIQDGSSTKPLIYLAKPDYTALTSTLYLNPTQWLVTGSTPSFSTFGNNLYVSRQNADNTFTEFLYKIDKTNTKITLISSRPISNAVASSTKNSKFVEQAGSIYVYYEYQSGDDITLTKRLIGSQALQTTIRGIDSKDAGLTTVGSQVYLCPAGCSYCLTSNTCETCLPGYVLDTNKNCLRCGPLCVGCAATDLTTCVGGCIGGNYWTGSVCSKCNENCVTCSAAASTCTSCRVGFYLSGSTCVACIDNCVACNPVSATDAKCNTCRKGFVYNSVTNTCVKCVAGCTNCNPLKVYECLTCADGFESSTVNSVLVCTKCPDSCKTCIAGVCQICRDSFRLVNNTCIAQCKLPCKECSTTDSTKCTSCVGGYTLNGESCVPDLSCNSAKTCTTCPLGYNLILGECIACNGGANCRTCDNVNIQVCASCSKGYFLTETSTCTVCNITGCVSCNSATFCQQCKAGYILSSPSDGGKCLRCDQSCLTCFDSPSNCETCAVGYTKKGWNCINNNNIKMELKIDAVFGSFTTANYASVEQDICDKIGKDTKSVNIQELKTGSVIIVATIDSSNIGQQTTLLATLQAALAVGSSIGGFPIQLSTLTAVSADAANNNNNNGNVVTPQNVYVADDAQAKRYRDIAIIVGVVIPVGLIIIFIILFILYKKGIICSNEPTKVREATMDQININQKESELHTMRKN